MSAFLFAVALALAWFAAINVAFSVASALIGWVVSRTALGADPDRASRIYMALGLLPGLASLAFVGLLFVPAHWQFEPAQAEESLGRVLVGLVVVGAGIVAATVVRALRTMRETGLVARDWARSARQVARTPEDAIPIMALPDAGTVIALVGFRRPTLFLSSDVTAALTEEELAASLAHEEAHHRSRDNLKRLVAAWSPNALDALGWAGGVGRRWLGAMELAADARAAAGSEQRAAVLASALVKVARLMTVPGYAAAGVSRLHDDALLAARVSRLLGPVDASQPQRTRTGLRVAAASAAAVAGLLAIDEAWLTIHTVTEGLIRWLP